MHHSTRVLGRISLGCAAAVILLLAILVVADVVGAKPPPPRENLNGVVTKDQVENEADRYAAGLRQRSDVKTAERGRCVKLRQSARNCYLTVTYRDGSAPETWRVLMRAAVWPDGRRGWWSKRQYVQPPVNPGPVLT